MSSQHEFLKKVIQKLSEAGIDYMVCGSVAASYYGLRRSTEDADVVIDGSERQLRRFVNSIENDLYVSPEAAMEALRHKTMFNVIDIKEAWKADLIIRKRTPFDEEEFVRRRKADLLGEDLWVASAEDTILSKLQWAKESQSQRQCDDVARILETQTGQLDLDYLRKWSRKLGVEESLDKLLKELQELHGDNHVE